MDGKRNIAERLDEALFDEHSPHLDRFGLLLLTIVVSLVVLSLVDIAPGGENVKAGVGGMVIAFSVSAMLVLAVRASGVKRSWRRATDVIAAVAIVASLLVLTGDIAGWRGIDPEDATPLPSPLWVVLSLFLPVIVVRRILRHRRVAVSTLLGAVCAYLLIAFTFTFVFLTLNALEATAFFGQAEPTTSFYVLQPREHHDPGDQQRPAGRVRPGPAAVGDRDDPRPDLPRDAGRGPRRALRGQPQTGSLSLYKRLS